MPLNADYNIDTHRIASQQRYHRDGCPHFLKLTGVLKLSASPQVTGRVHRVFVICCLYTIAIHVITIRLTAIG